jgi:hypothetical protein
MSNPPVDARRDFARQMRRLTPKQRKFVRSLPKHDFQPWGVCTALGYSTHTVWKWMRNAEVTRAREMQSQMAQDELDVSDRRVLAGYAAIERASIKHLYDASGQALSVEKLDDATAYAIAERIVDADGRVRYKFHDKRFALEAMARIRTIGVPRQEITGKGGTPLMPEQHTSNDREIARRVAFILARGMAAPEAPPAASPAPTAL